jgi:tetratricopeptide (TPR) repeat protein
MVATTYEQASRMGTPRAIALCRSFGGFLHFQRGEWARAENELREAIDLYRKTGSASGEALSLQRLGVLLTARGAVEEGVSALEEGISVAERATMRSHCLTRLYASMARNRLAAGEPEAADEFIVSGEETARRHGHCLTCNTLLLPEAVRARISVGRIELAEREAAELEEIARRFGSSAWNAMALQARARVLAARGEWEPAARSFAEAARAFRDVQAHYDAARCLMGQAQALRASRDPSKLAEANALAEAAAARIASLGASSIES